MKIKWARFHQSQTIHLTFKLQVKSINYQITRHPCWVFLPAHLLLLLPAHLLLFQSTFTKNVSSIGCLRLSIALTVQNRSLKHNLFINSLYQVLPDKNYSNECAALHIKSEHVIMTTKRYQCVLQNITKLTFIFCCQTLVTIAAKSLEYIPRTVLWYQSVSVSRKCSYVLIWCVVGVGEILSSVCCQSLMFSCTEFAAKKVILWKRIYDGEIRVSLFLKATKWYYTLMERFQE